MRKTMRRLSWQAKRRNAPIEMGSKAAHPAVAVMETPLDEVVFFRTASQRYDDIAGTCTLRHGSVPGRDADQIKPLATR